MYEVKPGYEAQLAALIKRRKAELANMRNDDNAEPVKSFKAVYKMIKRGTAYYIKLDNIKRQMEFNERIDEMFLNALKEKYA